MICDFAETYNIYDYKKQPLRIAAVLCYGLRDDSRVKMKLADIKYSNETLLMAYMADKLADLVWMHTEDATKGRNRPKSIYGALVSEEESEYMGFETAEDFEEARRKIIDGTG